MGPGMGASTIGAALANPGISTDGGPAERVHQPDVRDPCRAVGHENAVHRQDVPVGPRIPAPADDYRPSVSLNLIPDAFNGQQVVGPDGNDPGEVAQDQVRSVFENAVGVRTAAVKVVWSVGTAGAILCNVGLFDVGTVVRQHRLRRSRPTPLILFLVLLRDIQHETEAGDHWQAARRRDGRKRSCGITIPSSIHNASCAHGVNSPVWRPSDQRPS